MTRINEGDPLRSTELEDYSGPPDALLESRLAALRDRLRELRADDASARASVLLESGHVLLELQRAGEAARDARQAFDLALPAREIGQAVDALNVLYHSDTEHAIAALGQAIWLAVTFPIDPGLTVTMLQNLIDETPDDADGAAVAAATAHFIVDLRTTGKQREDLNFFTARLLGTVARRHAGIEQQAEFEAWCERLELSDPDKFLVRLRNVVDVLVQDDWWFDRDALRAELPDG